MASLPHGSRIDQVVVIIQGQSKKTIRDQDGFDEALKSASESDANVKLSLSKALVWSATFFLLLVRFCVALKGKILFFVNGKAQSENLFEALLNVPIVPNDIDQFSDYKRKLLVAVIVFHADAIGPCCKRIKDHFDELGFEGETTTRLISAAKLLAEELAGNQEGEADSIAVVEVLQGFPVDESVVVPGAYRLSMEGVAASGKDRFIATPVLIVSRLKDVNSGLEKVKIGWFRDGKWHYLIVSRKSIADYKSIVALADHGIPVTSENSAELISFLAAFEAVNLESLPVESVTTNLGYHSTSDGHVFVLPTTTIRSSGCPAKIEFMADDEGLQQIALGYHAKGNLDQWKTAVNLVKELPKMLLAVMASLTPAVFVLVECLNLIIDYCGRTSGGKTITLRLGASTWGNPDEKCRESALHTWSATKTFIERVAGFANNIVLVIDDSKNASSPEHVSQTVFLIAQGSGRGRAHVKGLQTTVSFRTIALSSGERPLVSFTNDGGTRARILTIWGSPLDDFNHENGALAGEINEVVANNYGLAGPALVQFLLDNQERWPEWQELFETEKQKYTAWAKEADNDFAGRMAPSLAAISLTHLLAHECFEFEFDCFDLIEPLWEIICNESAEADQAKAALEFAYGWAVSHQDSFCRGTGDRVDKHPPTGGYTGRWDREDRSSCIPGHEDEGLEDQPDAEVQWNVDDDFEKEDDFEEEDEFEDEFEDEYQDEDEDGCLPNSSSLSNATWPWIGFIRSKLEQILRDGGFDAEAVIRSWHDNGWLSTQEPGRLTHKMRIGSEKALVNAIAVRREAIEAVCEGI